MTRPWALFPILLVTGCPEQVRLIAQDPTESHDTPPPHDVGPAELEDDEKMVEPEHPAVQSPQEKALVHIHTPGDVCSGILIAPKLVATAHQCFGPDVKGTFSVPDKEKDAYRVEVASSTLTWTVRKPQTVVTPTCDWKTLDLAIVILDDAAPSAPVSMATAPSPGANVQALGFGHCRGDTKPFSGRTGTILARQDSQVVVDVVLCQGDVGGAVFDSGANGYVGVVSRKAEGGPGNRTATSIARFDTQHARDLIAAADALSKGQAAPKPISCD